MKIKRSIYFALVLAGAALLFASPSFAVREIGLALGFSLLMLGLYGISRRSGPSGKPPLKTEDHEGL